MRQSNTYSNVIDGKLVRTPKPLTKGKALVLARGILGPSARLYECGEFYVDLGPNEGYIAKGKSWEDMLVNARNSDQATRWSERQIAQDNEIALAVNSLNKKRGEVMQDRIARAKELVESAFKKVRVKITGFKDCKCGRWIAANAITCLECSQEVSE